MLAEADNLAAVPSLDKTAHCQDGPLPQQTSGRVPLSMDNAVETRESASALPKPRKSTKGPATPADQSSKNATAAPDAVQKESEAEQKRQPQIRQKFEPGRLSKLSTDQAYSDDTLDRFGSVDGKPTRDLKLDPVLQFVKWRESILGSRDFVSESKDVDSLDQDNE